MNAPLKTLNEMQRLTSPFPESVAVKEWKAMGRFVIGWYNPYVPEEIIHAAGMLPFEVTGDNEPVQMQGAEAHIYSNSCSKIRTCWQLQLDGKYSFLDGYVSSHMCDQDMRLAEVWAYYKKLPYMDGIYAPRKRDEEAVKLYQTDLEGFRSRLSQFLLIEAFVSKFSVKALDESIITGFSWACMFNNYFSLFSPSMELGPGKLRTVIHSNTLRVAIKEADLIDKSSHLFTWYRGMGKNARRYLVEVVNDGQNSESFPISKGIAKKIYRPYLIGL